MENNNRPWFSFCTWLRSADNSVSEARFPNDLHAVGQAYPRRLVESTPLLKPRISLCTPTEVPILLAENINASIWLEIAQPTWPAVSPGVQGSYIRVESFLILLLVSGFRKRTVSIFQPESLDNDIRSIACQLNYGSKSFELSHHEEGIHLHHLKRWWVYPHTF